jgi:hypothetical protein
MLGQGEPAVILYNRRFMITVSGVSMRFGSMVLFEDVTTTALAV